MSTEKTEQTEKQEYKQLKKDVRNHGRKVRILEKARREIKFANVLAEETTATALDFEK